MQRPLLEVIVQTLADAKEAQRGGADRLEVVRDIDDGGLTPSVEVARAIAGDVGLPLRVMIRRNAGYSAEPDELVLLRQDAAAMASLDVDGLVVGFARDGELEITKLADVLGNSGDAPVTLHRAFDQLSDPLGALEELAQLPSIDRVLTGGGVGPASVRTERLVAYQQRAGARLTIIAGGGVDDEMLDQIVRYRLLREVHVGRAAREGDNPSAPVSAAKVARLREKLSVTP